MDTRDAADGGDAGPAPSADGGVSARGTKSAQDAAVDGAEIRGVAGPRWVGRVDLSGDHPRFAWQGAGLIATVVGSEISVRLSTEGDSPIFFQPILDGTVGRRFEVTGEREVTLATGLDSGPHRVELYRDTEGQHGISAFLGFTRGQLGVAPASSGRVLEIVGDSISAGYGNLGHEVHPNGQPDPVCRGIPENSSWYMTYAAIAGRELDAEVSTIAHTGWGISRDAEGDLAHVVPALWDRTFSDPSSQAWNFRAQVSAVVINLGTNDWKQGDPGARFADEYEEFLVQIRARYREAWIFPSLGSMLRGSEADECFARMRQVIARRNAAGDDKLRLVDLGEQAYGADGLDPTGCNWHPDLDEGERMAGVLARELSTTLGW